MGAEWKQPGEKGGEGRGGGLRGRSRGTGSDGRSSGEHSGPDLSCVTIHPVRELDQHANTFCTQTDNGYTRVQEYEGLSPPHLPTPTCAHAQRPTNTRDLIPSTEDCVTTSSHPPRRHTRRVTAGSRAPVLLTEEGSGDGAQTSGRVFPCRVPPIWAKGCHFLRV